ncbi:hypothetical protein MHU86_21284 [Fragilaria crotonensis]|nr:hypothetical protein MHU86_21284 [Fragilaria crotonensis]
MASFIATTNDRPEAFSLFSCGPQPLEKKSLTGGADDSDAVDDLMRMQLKVADSTTGLSDKDIKKLTLVSTWCLAPSRLGWFVEQRIQQYHLTSCASCGHIDAVNTTLFDFQAERQHLEDGMFLPPLCPYLKAKLGPADATRAATSGGGASGKGGSSYPTSTVRNPSGRLFKITSRDVWRVSGPRQGGASPESLLPLPPERRVQRILLFPGVACGLDWRAVDRTWEMDRVL